MTVFLIVWAVAAVVAAVVLGQAIAYRDRQVPGDDGPASCPGCGCALCPDFEPEDPRERGDGAA